MLLWQNIQRVHKTGPNCDAKTRFAIWSTRQCEATKPFEKLGRTTFASPNSICFSSPKNGHEKIEQFNDIILCILCILPCLAESSGVHNAGTLSTLSPLWIKFQQVCRLRPTPARLCNSGHPNCHKTVVKPTFYIPSLLAECTGVIKSKGFPVSWIWSGAHAVIENPIFCGRITMTMLALMHCPKCDTRIVKLKLTKRKIYLLSNQKKPALTLWFCIRGRPSFRINSGILGLTGW